MALSSSKSSYIALTVLFVCIFIGFGTLGMKYSTIPSEEAASVESSGQALIGGNFALQTAHGKPYTQENLKGHYSLVFFGFSNCPDMCPTALSAVTATLEALPESVATQITPVFISVDPTRDTPEALAKYAENFHPSLVSLTGTPEAVKEAADAFKVFFSKADVMKDQDGNYMVNHSGYLYLMDTNGAYLKHFPHTVTPEELGIALQQAVGK